MENKKQENNAKTISGQFEAGVIRFFVEVTDTAL